MIRYDNNTIGKMMLGGTQVGIAYNGNVKCFNNGIEGGDNTPSQKPCFAVSEDLTYYEPRTYVDLYDKKTKKWYKLNNLKNYEEYGAYGDSLDTTKYVGKLIIVDGVEYEWDGTQWVNVGKMETEWYTPTDDELDGSGACSKPFTKYKFTIKVPSGRVRVSDRECYPYGGVTLSGTSEVGVEYDTPNGQTLYIPRNAWELEGLGFSIMTETEPKHYEAKAAPHTDTGYYSFASIEEAKEFECPWVGMKVSINETLYEFNENFEWVLAKLDPSNYLVFTALEKTDFYLKDLINVQSGNTLTETTGTLYYSIDEGLNWNAIEKSVHTPTINAGESIWWMGDLIKTEHNAYGIGRFTASGRFNAGGRMQALVRKHNYEKIDYGYEYCFTYLFSGSSMVSAEELIIDQIGTSGCLWTFHSCKSLVKAPKLEVRFAYNFDFWGCFYDCNFLVEGPEKIPEPRGQGCFAYMFYQCNSLRKAPTIPDFTLITAYKDCYKYMFYACGSLQRIETKITHSFYWNNAYYFTENWVQGVNSSGTFVLPKSNTWTTHNISSIPRGWTIEYIEE